MTSRPTAGIVFRTTHADGQSNCRDKARPRHDICKREILEERAHSYCPSDDEIRQQRRVCSGAARGRMTSNAYAPTVEVGSLGILFRSSMR